MIGRTTFLCLLLAAIAGYGLFQVKYQVSSLEEELSRLNAATLREQNQIHVLEAEWSYLNQPQRLEELNERHVHLKPIAPDQFGSLAALPLRPEPLPDSEPGVRLPGTEGMIARILPPRRPASPAPATPAYSTAASRPGAPPAPSPVVTMPSFLPVSVPR